jgi:NADH dehydrogenase
MYRRIMSAAVRPRVVVLGGGFGGLSAARALRHAPVDVLLIDRRNHHVFQPLLYQVATAALSPGDIASPIRWILRRQRNVQVWLGEVTHIAPAEKRVHLADGAEVPYDHLIVATGATHAYFGQDQWRELAPGLKTLEDALEIRRRVLVAFERAERELDGAVQRKLLTFVVIGGGPTGVELAGALAEISRHALANDFREIAPETARIILIEGGAELLGTYPQPLSAFARKSLERLGVAVWTGSRVVGLEGNGGHLTVRLDSGDSIQAGTILWAAGVAASRLGRSLGVETDRVGRVLVQNDLTIPGHPEIAVVGDLAAFKTSDGEWLPGVANVAIQQARHASQNIERRLRGETSQPFVYRNLGNMATIGRNSAVADFGWMRVKGYVAWLMWLFLHIFELIGFRNRLSVMIQWAFAYLSYQRSVRLITDESRRAEHAPR